MFFSVYQLSIGILAFLVIDIVIKFGSELIIAFFQAFVWLVMVGDGIAVEFSGRRRRVSVVIPTVDAADALIF